MLTIPSEFVSIFPVCFGRCLDHMDRVRWWLIRVPEPEIVFVPEASICAACDLLPFPTPSTLVIGFWRVARRGWSEFPRDFDRADGVLDLVPDCELWRQMDSAERNPVLSSPRISVHSRSKVMISHVRGSLRSETGVNLLTSKNDTCSLERGLCRPDLHTAREAKVNKYYIFRQNKHRTCNYQQDHTEGTNSSHKGEYNNKENAYFRIIRSNPILHRLI